MYNIITNVESCYAFIKDVPFGLIYYSHIPTAIISLIMGVFVLFKNTRSLVSRILFVLSLIFSLWSFADLIIWIYGYNSIVTMLAWSMMGILNVLLFIMGLYFVYVFIDKKDISLTKKIILVLLILPIILVTPTRFSIDNFSATGCSPIEYSLFSNYQYIVNIIISIWIASLFIIRYRKVEENFKKQLLLLSLGIISFFASFFTTGYLAPYLYELGFVSDYRIESFGLFGMTIFIGFLAYLIVKFKAFNIKLLGTQAMVITLFILVASELFFAESFVNLILIQISMIILLGVGYMLVKSVKLEVQRKEELQSLSDKLEQANVQLKKLDKAKSEFISIASHQLRTPLTSIKGYVSLIVEGTYGKVDPKIKDALSKVYMSNERLIQLVENLLNISRIESGRIEYTYDAWQVEKIINELADNFIFAAKKKQLYLRLDLPKEPLPTVRIDGAKVKEVISNMIDNAIKYTPTGGVTVSAEKSDDGVRIIVADTGIGVPKDEVSYVFSKFSRGKDTSRLQASGTGLGMYVGKSLIEAQNGKIWVESEGDGKGSRFIVELPLHQTETKEKETFSR